MGVMKNVLFLLAYEAVGVFLLYVVLKNVFGIDIFDFSTPRGKMIGGGMVLVFLVSFYSVLFEPGELRTIGAAAKYNESDQRRTIGASSMRPAYF